VNGDSLLAKGAAAQRPSRGWPYKPGYCYNAMIAPITNYVLAGALWYQGEGNTVYPASYGRLFGAMIGSWRQVWKKELPFYYVQIAPFTYGAGNTGALIREQQAECLKLPNTGMVVVSDLVNDTTNIHPKDKHDVGYRLAAWALAETYHKSGIAYKSPMYKDMTIKGDRATVNIDVAPGGLMLKGIPIRELVIAGADRAFHPAQAKIDGNRLIVWSPEVKRPVAVRYQFDNAGMGNVFSKEGLPLAPFRTDDW
jgi:sialate O-acetylesterase